VVSTEDAVRNELHRVRTTFAHHVTEMTSEDLRQKSNGTQWTNREVLFHMLFGYLLVLNLLRIAKLLGPLPRWSTKPFAAILNFGTPLFHRINYLGSVIGGRILQPHVMVRRFDWVTKKIEIDFFQQDGKN
jgi:hypothetical protein